MKIPREELDVPCGYEEIAVDALKETGVDKLLGGENFLKICRQFGVAVAFILSMNLGLSYSKAFAKPKKAGGNRVEELSDLSSLEDQIPEELRNKILSLIKDAGNLHEKTKYVKMVEILIKHGIMGLDGTNFGLEDNPTNRKLLEKYGIDPESANFIDPNETPKNQYGDELEVWATGTTLKLKVGSSVIEIPQGQGYFMDAEGLSLDSDSWKKRQEYSFVKIREALKNLKPGGEVDILKKEKSSDGKTRYKTHFTLRKKHYGPDSEEFVVQEVHSNNLVEKEESLQHGTEVVKTGTKANKAELKKDIESDKVKKSAEELRAQLKAEKELLVKEVTERLKNKEIGAFTDRELEAIGDNPMLLKSAGLSMASDIQRTLDELTELNAQKIESTEAELEKARQELSETQEKGDFVDFTLERKVGDLENALEFLKNSKASDNANLEYINFAQEFNKVRIEEGLTTREQMLLMQKVKQIRDNLTNLESMFVSEKIKQLEEEKRIQKNVQVTPKVNGIEVKTANSLLSVATGVEAGGLMLEGSFDAILGKLDGNTLGIKIESKNSPLLTKLLASLNIFPNENRQFIITAGALGKKIEINGGEIDKKVWQKTFGAEYKETNLDGLFEEFGAGLVFAQVDNTEIGSIYSETASQKITTYYAAAGGEVYKAHVNGKINFNEYVNLVAGIEAEYHRLYAKYDQEAKTMLNVGGIAELNAQLAKDLEASFRINLSPIFKQYKISLRYLIEAIETEFEVSFTNTDYHSDYPGDNARDNYIDLSAKRGDWKVGAGINPGNTDDYRVFLGYQTTFGGPTESKNNTPEEATLPLNPYLEKISHAWGTDGDEFIVKVREAEKQLKESKEAISAIAGGAVDVGQSVSIPLTNLFNLVGVNVSQLNITSVNIPGGNVTWARVGDNIEFTGVANVDRVNDSATINVSTPGGLTASADRTLNDIDTLANAGAAEWNGTVPAREVGDPAGALTFNGLKVDFPEPMDTSIVGTTITGDNGGSATVVSISGDTVTFDYVSPPGPLGPPNLTEDLTFSGFKDEAGNTFSDKTVTTGVL